ncbi:MAG: hypothetical protein ACI8P9_000431 [Parasphingorhabdus sp.]|jgi:hypothetical protein
MSLNVVGVGMGRTGTASLKVALEQLGIGRCYHMTEVMQHPVCIQDWVNAANGTPDWDKIFDGYGATVDNPACGFWKELCNFYSQAKVILTVRDAESWFNSTNETIHSTGFASFIKNSPWGEMIQRTIFDTMDNRMQDKDFMMSFFNNRSDEIIDTIAPERLLIYKVADGWGPLCEFLEIGEPDIDFPRINSRNETKELLDSMMAASGDKMNDDAMSEAAKTLHGD